MANGKFSKPRTTNRAERELGYPMFVKPARAGSSVGVSKASDRESLRRALLAAGTYDEKILVEEFIHGREVEVAVMGNDSPVASICGEIDSGADFYDYDSKYVTDTSTAYIPARIPEDVAEQVRDLAVKVYSSIGCQGLSRVDFFVTYEENRVVFNEINTLPGFTSISMYPKLFAASGIPYGQLIDQLDGSLTSGSSAVYKGVANGEYTVGLSYEVGVAGYIANGAQGVRAVYPTEGVCWTPVGSAIVNGAKNVDNAKLFMDWLISEENQTTMAKAEGSVLRGVRTDLFVANEFMPAFDTLNIKYEDSDYTSGNKQTILDHWNDLWNK